MNKIAAVVVTYNRKELLTENLHALLKQSYRDFDIFVIDNASTDGTFGHIETIVRENGIQYINTGENLGGAGGFNFGIKAAVKAGYEYVWIMDDDTLPYEDALSELVNGDAELCGDYGFLSGLALWTDGTPCRMNKQKLLPMQSGDKFPKTNYATFVSLFIKADVVREIGLPIKEFFIWGDDIEYTNRISKKYDCYFIEKSRVLHKTQNNEGSNIATDDSGRVDRYAYAYRNEMYIAKANGVKGVIRQFAKIALHIVRVIFKSKKDSFKKLGIIIKSSAKGISFNPDIELIKD